MTNKDEDQAWLDALAGKPDSDNAPEASRHAKALRRAIQRHEASFQAGEADMEAGLQKLRFRLRQEGLTSAERRPFMSRRFVQFAVAASVVLTVGLMVRAQLHQELPQNEAEIMRGTGERQLMLAADPEQRVQQLAGELARLGIPYQVERKEGKILLKMQGVDPVKEAVADFLERNHIKPPVKDRLELDIRPLAKP